MPIFGNDGTPEASSFYSALENIINFGRARMGRKSGRALSASVHLDALPIGPGTVRVKLALYRTCDRSLVGETEERSFNIQTMGAALQTFNFVCPVPLLGGADYYIAPWCDSVAGNVRVRLNGAGGHGFSLQDCPYGEWPNPATPDEQTPTGNLFAYVTYVENA